MMESKVQNLEVPRFTVAEREQRWRRVRQLMERDGIDVIVAPSSTGASYGRYLSGIGVNGSSAAVVFPRTGEVTALTNPVPSQAYWLRFQDWVTDIRANFFAEGDALVECLREFSVERSRIGLVGLADMQRLPDGIISHGIYMKLRHAFPNAELVNATFLMDEARFVKSEEEITFLTRAIELVEEAIEILQREARPGVPECVVYAHMIASMVEQGGELPTLLLWAAGSPQPLANAFMPTQRKLQRGDIVTSEIEAVWGGYRGQVTVTGVIGNVSSAYAEMFHLQQEIVDRVYERFRPGVALSEFLNIGEEVTRGTSFHNRMIMHSRGLGNDAPIAVFGGLDERIKNWRIEENSIFVIKPVVMTDEWLRTAFGSNIMIDSRNMSTTAHGARAVFWGDSVVATPSGARRLGKRPRAFLEIGR